MHFSDIFYHLLGENSWTFDAFLVIEWQSSTLNNVFSLESPRVCIFCQLTVILRKLDNCLILTTTLIRQYKAV